MISRRRPAVRLDGQTLGHAAGPRARRSSGRTARRSSSSPTPTSFTTRRHAGAAGRAASLAQDTVLTSLMVKLRCESLAERLLIPAFVFFFQMLYPFAWVNDPANRTAAAAGGCMLVRREALQAAGGLDAIRGALIDDCALGRADEGPRADLARPDRAACAASAPIRVSAISAAWWPARPMRSCATRPCGSPARSPAWR